MVKSVFAVTNRGLEHVCADEIAALTDVTVDRVSYRRVSATCAAPLRSLLELRTVDDVFLDIATWRGIGRPRSVLAIIGSFSAQLDLAGAAAVCANLRPIGSSPSFSVTANFVGKRNYSAAEIKQACAEGILTQYPDWKYASDDRAADLNLRVFIEHDSAYVGLRLARDPLHRRPYKQQHVPGSLKPTVAAALLTLARITPGMRLLDPCCGAGTILVEAAPVEAFALGGDNDPGALTAAQINSRAAGIVVQLQRWDARVLPVADSSIDRIVCNLPWGREVPVDATLGALYSDICTQMRRVLAPGGRIALLTSAPHLVDLGGLQCTERIEISLFGQTPTILIFDTVIPAPP
jgi:tRNA (guanine6-N2)-methyltransferase